MLPELIRKNDLDQIYEAVMERKNVHLYGPYGSGKNYLVKHLKKRLIQRRVCISVNLAFIQSWEMFFANFQQKINNTAKNTGALYLHLKRFLENNPYPLKPETENVLEWLDQFSYSLEQTGTDYLFILKNFDQQNFVDDNARLLCLALTKGRTCQLLLSSTQHPLDDKLFSALNLAPITNTHFTPEASETLREALAISRGNLKFLDELLSTPGENYTEKLNTILNRYHNFFLQIKSRFTKMQWNLLKAIAIDEFVPQPHAFEFLVKHHLGAASSVERALTNLKTTSYIIKTEEGWQVADVYLHRWLRWIYKD